MKRTLENIRLVLSIIIILIIMSYAFLTICKAQCTFNGNYIYNNTLDITNEADINIYIDKQIIIIDKYKIPILKYNVESIYNYPEIDILISFTTIYGIIELNYFEYRSSFSILTLTRYNINLLLTYNNGELLL
jgi:hypothetical protein